MGAGVGNYVQRKNRIKGNQNFELKDGQIVHPIPHNRTKRPLCQDLFQYSFLVQKSKTLATVVS